MKLRTAVKVGAVGVVMMLATACSSSSTAAGSGTKGSSGPFKIGVSNAFVASEYRTQMIDAIRSTFDEYKAQGVVSTLVMENADTDVNGQIQQIRNLINQGVDAIIVDPNSASALDAVFQEAISQGIKVIAIDQAVDSEKVTNIGISQQELGAASATWFAATVGDGASIVTVEGAAGNPATDARWAGAKKVFDAHGIKVLAHGDGGWDQATGQTVATNLLATYPKVSGIWTYDGMAQGVLRAVEAANATKTVVVGGEARVGFLRMWSRLQPSGFSSVGVINPPGTGATAVRFAVKLLQGKTIIASKITDGHDVVLPLEPSITNDTLAAQWAKVSSKEDTYVLDAQLSDADVSQYFQ